MNSVYKNKIEELHLKKCKNVIKKICIISIHNNIIYNKYIANI